MANSYNLSFIRDTIKVNIIVFISIDLEIFAYYLYELN